MLRYICFWLYFICCWLYPEMWSSIWLYSSDLCVEMVLKKIFFVWFVPMWLMRCQHPRTNSSPDWLYPASLAPTPFSSGPSVVPPNHLPLDHSAPDSQPTDWTNTHLHQDHSTRLMQQHDVNISPLSLLTHLSGSGRQLHPCRPLGSWCRPLRAWCLPLVCWCRPLMSWYRSLFCWCRPLVSWCQPTGSWCRPLMAWCWPLGYLYRNLRAWWRPLRSWCRSLESWCRLFVSWRRTFSIRRQASVHVLVSRVTCIVFPLGTRRDVCVLGFFCHMGHVSVCLKAAYCGQFRCSLVLPIWTSPKLTICPPICFARTTGILAGMFGFVFQLGMTLVFVISLGSVWVSFFLALFSLWRLDPGQVVVVVQRTDDKERWPLTVLQLLTQVFQAVQHQGVGKVASCVTLVLDTDKEHLLVTSFPACAFLCVFVELVSYYGRVTHLTHCEELPFWADYIYISFCCCWYSQRAFRYTTPSQ